MSKTWLLSHEYYIKHIKVYILLNANIPICLGTWICAFNLLMLYLISIYVSINVGCCLRAWERKRKRSEGEKKNNKTTGWDKAAVKEGQRRWVQVRPVNEAIILWGWRAVCAADEIWALCVFADGRLPWSVMWETQFYLQPLHFLRIPLSLLGIIQERQWPPKHIFIWSHSPCPQTHTRTRFAWDALFQKKLKLEACKCPPFRFFLRQIWPRCRIPQFVIFGLWSFKNQLFDADESCGRATQKTLPSECKV